MQIFLSEYIYMIILRCVVHKLYVAKHVIPPGISQIYGTTYQKYCFCSREKKNLL